MVSTARIAVVAVDKTHSLSMQISRSAFDIDKIAIDTALIYPVELALIRVEVGLAQRPCLSQVHLLESVSDLDELVISVLEAFVDFALPGT